MNETLDDSQEYFNVAMEALGTIAPCPNRRTKWLETRESLDEFTLSRVRSLLGNNNCHGF